VVQINMAHLREQGIDFAVFDADARAQTNHARADLLAQLTIEARRSGLKVDKAALAYSHGSRIEFYGTPDLVRYLANGWTPYWTHTLTVN